LEGTRQAIRISKLLISFNHRPISNPSLSANSLPSIDDGRIPRSANQLGVSRKIPSILTASNPSLITPAYLAKIGRLELKTSAELFTFTFTCGLLIPTARDRDQLDSERSTVVAGSNGPRCDTFVEA